MQLSSPKVHVVAEDVEKGKPDPACYALGIQRLGLETAKEAAILVIEGFCFPLSSPHPHVRSRVSGPRADTWLHLARRTCRYTSWQGRGVPGGRVNDNASRRTDQGRRSRLDRARLAQRAAGESRFCRGKGKRVSNRNRRFAATVSPKEAYRWGWVRRYSWFRLGSASGSGKDGVETWGLRGFRHPMRRPRDREAARLFGRIAL